MRDIPECLNRRYKALDELIEELSSHEVGNPNPHSSSNDPEIKLMCEFWNILKEDPGVNLKQAVQQRMGLNTINSGLFGNNVGCYMAGCCRRDNTKKHETVPKTKNISSKNSTENPNTTPQPKICSSSKVSEPEKPDPLPLNKVLCNLKQAASFEKKCHVKVNELLENQKQLQDQIVILEQREKDGVQLLKQADCMWSCMEESYKRNIAECLERQQCLLKQLKEVEASNKKWRNNKKDLEFEMDNITKCHQEIIEQINHKTNDVKCIDLEILNFKNRIESDKKDIEVALKSLTTKKQASDGKMSSMATEIAKLEKKLIEEQKYKATKEEEGRKYVKEARDDLQKLCKILLQKKLENEDMKAEREALILEFEMLKQTCDQCREKCKNKQESINDEIRTIEKEIADFKVRCIRCHECTDTMDVRKFCTDCPRCANEQECLYEEDHCSPDHTMDCVCTTIKQKFLDNVFENMYTLLERQVKTGQGKAVAEAVMNCLKNSRNGKINNETKSILQDFILTTVKKNLKLTIVGGAVKTRCEMDPETYKQLMLCLKEVKITKPVKADKGTDSKKDPCKRWGGSSECNCPKGPKACVCIGKGFVSSNEAQTLPPPVQDNEDTGEVVACPYRDSAPCGADCAARDAVGSEVAAWRPNPCQGPTCNFKNMRAAQCVLGPEVLSSVPGPYIATPPILENQATCKCSGIPTIPCACHKDLRSQPRERIIQEVMGRYTEVTPIEKVVSMDGNDIRKSNEERKLYDERVSEMSLSKQNNLPNTSTNKSFEYCNCSFHSLISTDSKEPKVGIADVCKNKCEMIPKSVDSRGKNEENIKHINFENKLIIENNKDLFRKPVKVLGDEKLKLADPPEISKSPSGDLKVALNKKLVEILDKKMQRSCNLCTKLKDTGNPGVDLVDRLSDLTSSQTDGKSKAIAKKTPSGNILLEIDKSLLNIKERSTIKLSSIGIHNAAEDNKEDKPSEIFNVKIKGADCDEKELLFALKATGSGNFEIVLDKEFEKWYKQTIKDYEGEDNKQYMHLTRTDSGNFLLNLEENNEEQLHSENALLLKSPSGNIKVIMNEEVEPLRKESLTKSVISARNFNDLLKKLPAASRQFHRENLKKSRLSKEKSNSDSHIYGKTRFNLQNEQNFLSEQTPVLKKTCSGEYAAILNKNSKKSFINNLKSYLTTSSKGLVPIKRTASGVIYVDLSNDVHGVSNYGSVKITPSGNIYITLDEQGAFPSKNVNTSSQNIKTNIKPQLPLSKNISQYKDIATICTPRNIDSECPCKTKCYKSKKMFLDHSKDGSSETHPCGQKRELKPSSCINKKSKSKCLHNMENIIVENKSPHIVIKPCGCRPMLEKSPTEDRYCFIQSVCPYHIDRYESLSNELLEISGLCSGSKCINDDNSVHIKRGENVFHVGDKNKQTALDWNTLEYLPPQLPLFLRDFNCV